MALTADERGVLVACPGCGQMNRLRFETITRQTRCASCQVSLPVPGTPVAVTSVRTFDALVAGTPLPIVVDFWAQWCGPCRAMAPEFERMAHAVAGKWLAVKVDTDQVPELGERYRIMSIPTLAVFHGGAEVGRTSGAMGAEAIQQFMQRAVAPRA